MKYALGKIRKCNTYGHCINRLVTTYKAELRMPLALTLDRGLFFRVRLGISCKEG